MNGRRGDHFFKGAAAGPAFSQGGIARLLDDLEMFFALGTDIFIKGHRDVSPRRKRYYTRAGEGMKGEPPSGQPLFFCDD
jgi:hypothetical protein